MEQVVPPIPPNSRFATDDCIQLLTFSLEPSGPLFAVEVRQVREVVTMPAITPVPGADASLLGVVSLRGALLNVHDLAQIVCSTASACLDRGVLIISDADTVLRAFWVHEVHAIERASRSEMRPLDDQDPQAFSLLQGVLLRDGNSMISVLDLATRPHMTETALALTLTA